MQDVMWLIWCWRVSAKWGSLHLKCPPKDSLVLQSEEPDWFPLVPRDKTDSNLSDVMQKPLGLFSSSDGWNKLLCYGFATKQVTLRAHTKEASAIWKLHSTRSNGNSDWIAHISSSPFPNEKLDEIKPPCNVIFLEQQPESSLPIPSPPPSSSPFLQHSHPRTLFDKVPWSWVTGHTGH